MEDQFECSCERACLVKYTNSDHIKKRCLTAHYIFERLERVIKLQADLKKGITLMPKGTALKVEGTDFFKYRVAAIIAAINLILDIEKCPSAREIIKNTDHEKIYFEAKEEYLEAIEKLMKISDEDILRLEKDHHYEIDL